MIEPISPTTSKIRDALYYCYNDDELRVLCTDLGIEYEDLKGDTRQVRVIELIGYLQRRGRIQDLIAVCSKQRPHVNWVELLKDVPSSKPEGRFNNLITCSDRVPIFTKGRSRLTATMISNALIVDFNNDQTWSGVALKFTPALDVREFSRLDISGIATQHFTFRIEYKVRVGSELKIVTRSSFQSFPATMLVSTIPIPLRYNGTVDEITLMFYERGEASHVTIESIRLSK